MRLKGKVAIVTGAGRGIGRAYALGFAREGAKVCIAELRAEAGERVAQEIRSQGGEAIAVQTDVALEESVRDMARKTAEALGGIDIIHNNAALFAGDLGGPDPMRWDALNGQMSEWHRLVEVNVNGVLHGIRAVVPYMKQRGKGKIINQSSVGAYIVGNASSNGPYATTKLAVIGLTRMFAFDLAPYKINVNAIAPGVVLTEASVSRGQTWEEARERMKTFASTIPLGRVAEPEDMVGCAIFLASDESDYVTGQTIVVDGGWVPRV